MSKVMRAFLVMLTLIVSVGCMITPAFAEGTESAAQTENAEADAVFNAYYEVLKELGIEEEDNGVFKTYIEWINASNFLERDGGTQEQWDAMTGAERFLWKYLYDTPVIALLSTKTSYEEKFGSEENFAKYIRERVPSKPVKHWEAYLEIMEWQRQYIVEHGTVYNFMTGEEYKLLGNNNTNTESKAEKTDLNESEAEEILQQIDQSTADSADSTESGIKDSLLVISALVIVILVIAVIIILKKQKSK